TVHIVLHHMPAGLEWSFSLNLSLVGIADPVTGSMDHTIQFRQRDSKGSDIDDSYNSNAKVSDGRLDIELNPRTRRFFMIIQMPLHTKIVLETDDGKEIYKDEIVAASQRTIANGIDLTNRQDPLSVPLRNDPLLRYRREVLPPKDGAFHILLHN